MSTIKYGFTGTRNGMSTEQKNNVIKLLQKDIDDKKKIEAHHGDCIGADKDFHNICTNLKITVIIHPPDNDKLRAFCKSDNVRNQLPYLDRNKNIVNETNILIACPVSKDEELRSGTWMTIRYAKKINRPVLIF